VTGHRWKNLWTALLLTMFFPFLKANAQLHLPDTLMLRDGKRVPGIVVQDNSAGVKLFTRGGEVKEFGQDQVESIIRGGPEGPKVKATKSAVPLKPRLHAGLSLGINTGVGKRSKDKGYTGAAAQAGISYGVLSAGAGFGIDSHDPDPLFPLTAVLKLRFLKGAVTPFIYGEAGYSFPAEQGGFIGDAGAGLQMKRATLAVGFRYQDIRARKVTYYGMNTCSISRPRTNCLAVKLGIDIL